MQAFCDHLKDTFNGWWNDLSHPSLDDATTRMLVEGAGAAASGVGHEDMLTRRDAMFTAVQEALRASAGLSTILKWPFPRSQPACAR